MENSIKWLLEDDNPSVSFNTRTEILGEKINNREISSIREQISESNPVKTILSLQTPGGWWDENTYSFNPLYRNTFWQLYFLSIFNVSNKVTSIDKAVKLVIKNMQDKNGSFPSTKRYKGNLICMQGITLEMLLRLGYRKEAFTKKLIAFIIDLVYRNDFRCKYRQQLRCPWGAVKVLKAFNLIPEVRKLEEVKDTANKAVKFILSHSIVDANYPRKKSRSKHWYMFGFPRGFQSDILELSGALVDAGCTSNNSNLKNALKLIYKKRLDDNTWKMDFSLNGKMLVDIEKKNKPSKWVTFSAIKTLVKSNYLKL
jgi:hypothetical protein